MSFGSEEDGTSTSELRRLFAAHAMSGLLAGKQVKTDTEMVHKAWVMACQMVDAEALEIRAHNDAVRERRIRANSVPPPSDPTRAALTGHPIAESADEATT